MSPDWDTLIGWALVWIGAGVLVVAALASAVRETRPQRDEMSR